MESVPWSFGRPQWARVAAAGVARSAGAQGSGARLGGWVMAAVVAAWPGTALRAWAAQATLVADAHVNSALPTVNSGAISNLNVGGGYTAFLQFDLSLLPAGTTATQVTRAVLRLYANRVTTPGMVSVAPVSSAWGEYTVTYATQPAVGAEAAEIPVGQAGAFVAVDVTGLVQGWVASPGTNFGVELTAATAAVQFDSKENDETSHAATLEVDLAGSGAVGAVGAVGPQGPQGPTGAVGPVGPAGAMGPIGLAGAAASVAVGTVTTGAAGTAAAVVNAGTAGAAVLNFTIPRGATGATGTAGGGGGLGAGGLGGVYHAVSFSYLYYGVNSAAASATEGAAVLMWVPAGCTATELTVFSQQANTITVTLRAGPMGGLADTALACSAAPGSTCTATGSVGVGAGSFLDLSVSGANGAPAAVWTAVGCG